MCEIAGCKAPAVAQGLCAKHYMRQRRSGDPMVKRKPGPKPKRPKAKQVTLPQLAQSASTAQQAMRREVVSLRRQVSALKRQADEVAKLRQQNAKLRALVRASTPARGKKPKGEVSRQALPGIDWVSDGKHVNFDNLKFAFAKTMPDIPHWYVKRTPENEKDYLRLFATIQKFGRVEQWGGKSYRYWYPGDGYRYWAMTTAVGQSCVINRART
jgi:hypothetical protein